MFRNGYALAISGIVWGSSEANIVWIACYCVNLMDAEVCHSLDYLGNWELRTLVMQLWRGQMLPQAFDLADFLPIFLAQITLVA